MVSFFNRNIQGKRAAKEIEPQEKHMIHEITREVNELLDQKGTSLKTVKEPLVTHYQLTNSQLQTRVVLSVQKVGIAKPLALKEKIQGEKTDSDLEETPSDPN